MLGAAPPGAQSSSFPQLGSGLFGDEVASLYGESFADGISSDDCIRRYDAGLSWSILVGFARFFFRSRFVSFSFFFLPDNPPLGTGSSHASRPHHLFSALVSSLVPAHDGGQHAS